MIVGANAGSLRALIRAKEAGELHTAWLGDQVSFLASQHVGQVEILTDGLFVFPELYSPQAIKDLARWSDRLRFSVHFPYLLVNLADLNEAGRQASIDRVVRAAEVMMPLRPHTYVVHTAPSRLPGPNESLPADVQGTDARYQPFIRQATRSVRHLVRRISSRRLCVENLVHGWPFRLNVPLIEGNNTSICFDIDHHLRLRGSCIDFLCSHGHRVTEVHVHDSLCTALAKREASDDVLDCLALLARHHELSPGPDAIILETDGRRDKITRCLRILREALGCS